MPRAKKDISKDLMFQKIMPSADLSGKRDEEEVESTPLNEDETLLENTGIDDAPVSEIATIPLPVAEATDVPQHQPQAVEKSFTPDPLPQQIPPQAPAQFVQQAPAHIQKPSAHQQTMSQQMVARTIAFSSDADSEGYLVNIMEKLVFDNLEAILSRFKCCKCDRCKKDMLALALNSLPPKYIVATKDKPPRPCHDPQVVTEVTTALVRAVVQVKKEPRH